MNERIKQLLNEATSGHEQEHDRSKVMTVSDKEMDKFAQLIVRECAKKGFDIFDEEPDAPASDLQFYVRDRIKEHFGVEE
jgi:hypothetical protein